MRRLVQSIAPLLVAVGITTGAASLAEAAAALPPTQMEWTSCRETDTFDACCRRFGGTSDIFAGIQRCNWGSKDPSGKWPAGVSNPETGSGAPASGDYVGNLPKKKRR